MLSKRLLQIPPIAPERTGHLSTGIWPQRRRQLYSHEQPYVCFPHILLVTYGPAVVTIQLPVKFGVQPFRTRGEWLGATWYQDLGWETA